MGGQSTAKKRACHIRPTCPTENQFQLSRFTNDPNVTLRGLLGIFDQVGTPLPPTIANLTGNKGSFNDVTRDPTYKRYDHTTTLYQENHEKIKGKS